MRSVERRIVSEAVEWLEVSEQDAPDPPAALSPGMQDLADDLGNSRKLGPESQEPARGTT